MKHCEEDKTLRNMSMHQLNEHLSELYKSLFKYSQGRDESRRTCCQINREIQKVKHEQTLRRKGLRTQGIWIDTVQQTNKIKSKDYPCLLPKIEDKELFEEQNKIHKTKFNSSNKRLEELLYYLMVMMKNNLY